MRPAVFLFLLAATGAAQTDWPTFGHDLGSNRFSPLRQITPENVSTLKRAWTYHMDPTGRAQAASETIPLVVGGILYLTTPYKRVVALEPETGKEIWAFDVPDGNPARRGLEYWQGDKQSPPQVFFGTDYPSQTAAQKHTGSITQSQFLCILRRYTGQAMLRLKSE
ncbi:MAG TPA: PQQ-binding-like beta-propeller repeat protein [Bryobacteraceae bacterium]|nr:PQQ-binding-like beta-propeller repeat protein [Bryobacteraceae bacterium]